MRGKVAAPGLKAGGKCRGDGEKHQSQISNQPGAQGVPGDGMKECRAGAAAPGFKVGESCAEVVRSYHKSAIRRRRTEAMRTES